MNPADLKDLDPADRAFASRARAALRASETLDYVESARLAATRARARELVMQPRRLPGWAWLAAPATVAALVAAVVLRPGTLVVAPISADELVAVAGDVNATAPEALIWTSDEAGPDFYRDLAFYEWLQSRSPSEPNA